MDPVPWPVALIGVVLWLGPPLLLVAAVTRSGALRLAFSVELGAILTLLYLPALDLLHSPGVPIPLEALILWGPITVVVGGVATLIDRRHPRQPVLDGAPGSDATGTAVGGTRKGPLLMAAFAAWSVCCGGCLFSPAAELMDIRTNSPTPRLVLPMPRELTLISATRGCGSELCSEIYLVGSPDQASLPELTDRLWEHLAIKGWKRMRDDPGCQRPGWFFRDEICLFVKAEQTGTGASLRVHVTGALAVV